MESVSILVVLKFNMVVQVMTSACRCSSYMVMEMMMMMMNSIYKAHFLDEYQLNALYIFDEI